jgi:hypothetical protein
LALSKGGVLRAISRMSRLGAGCQTWRQMPAPLPSGYGRPRNVMDVGACLILGDNRPRCRGPGKPGAYPDDFPPVRERLFPGFPFHFYLYLTNPPSVLSPPIESASRPALPPNLSAYKY